MTFDEWYPTFTCDPVDPALGDAYETKVWMRHAFEAGREAERDALKAENEELRKALKLVLGKSVVHGTPTGITYNVAAVAIDAARRALGEAGDE